MRPRFSFLILFLVAIAPILLSSPSRTRLDSEDPEGKRAYLGFDRNIYPGDEAMKTLRRDFVFAGYWLSPPPQEKASTWVGKRDFLRSLGFGFLVLYRARGERELKSASIAESLGEGDARAAAQAAKREGFSSNTIIFLDMEEGGRLSPNYHSYIQGWLWTLTQIEYQGGFYCSAIPVKEGGHSAITTADDITDFLSLKSRAFTIWAYNDACPPSPGCAFPKSPPSPELSGDSVAEVWQYAQSPRAKERTAFCAPGYRSDGNCYAPADTGHVWFLDVDSATSEDPSHGR